MCHHIYFTTFDKEMLFKYLIEGKKQKEIAELLGKNPSSISREIKKGLNDNGDYSPSLSNERTKKNLSNRGRKRILSKHKRLKNKIKNKIIKDKWSPEEIANRLKKNKAKIQISFSTIYREIHKRTFDNPKNKNKGFIWHLRRQGKAYKDSSKTEKRGVILITNPIETRPIEANNRMEIGHFELDTVCGKKNGACVLTAVDRKSRFLKATLCEMQRSRYIYNGIIRLFKDDNPEMLKSFTPDRGKEFSFHPQVTKELGIEFYFPNAHHPWERGTNERINADLREFFPRRKAIDTTEERLQEIVMSINLRPRKCLGYLTPFEVYYGVKLQLI